MSAPSVSSTTGPVDERGVTRAVLAAAADDRVTLAIPGTDYQLSLVPTLTVSTPVGKRARGIIEARALRMHPAAAGGAFIEPVYGAPRIVAGRVLAIDADANRVLVHAVVPMWITPEDGQTASDFAVDQSVNFYVESGTTFTPVPDLG